MTLTLLQAIPQQDLPDKIPPDLPQSFTEDSLVSYVRFYQAVGKYCDYKIGEALAQAKEELPHGQYESALKELGYSSQDASRLCSWYRAAKSPESGGLPPAIAEQKLSRHAREEFCRAEPEVQTAVLDYVKETENKVTADEIKKLRDEYEEKLRKLKAEADNWKEEAEASVELADISANAQMENDSLREALAKIKKEKEAASKEAREAKRKLTELAKELEEMKAHPPLRVIDVPTKEDNEKTDKTKENVVALFERYLLTACGDWRQGITRYHEYRSHMTDSSRDIIDKVLKNLHLINLQYLDENGDPKDTSKPIVNV
jgi:regulator of replication initiation timing